MPQTCYKDKDSVTSKQHTRNDKEVYGEVGIFVQEQFFYSSALINNFYMYVL